MAHDEKIEQILARVWKGLDKGKLRVWALPAVAISLIGLLLIIGAMGSGPGGDAPVAVADLLTVDEGTQVDAASVLENDICAEGDSLSAVLVSSTSNGSLALKSDGTYRYTHDGSKTTSDSFTYKVNNGSLDSNTVPVAITVNPVGEGPGTGTRVYKKTLRSVVGVEVPSRGYASGFVIDRAERLVVTAFHCVEDRDSVRVIFPAFKSDDTVITERGHYYGRNAQLIPGKVVLKLERKDLALLQLDRIPSGFVAVKIATVRVQPGQAVYTVGNPTASGGMWIFSNGSVRQIFAQQEFHLESGQAIVADIVETQNPTNPGDSGGPVVNSRGELVGMTMSGIVADDVDLVSQCIDATEINRLLSQYRRQ